MPELIQLPDNATALLKSSDQLSNKEVKILRRAARTVGLVGQHLKALGLDDIRSEDEAEADPESDEAKARTEASNAKALEVLTSISDEEDDDLDLFQRTCAAVRLIEWSLDLPLPKTPEDVDNLPRPIYSVLTTEAAKLDLNENFEATPEAVADASSPTDASDSSARL